MKFDFDYYRKYLLHAPDLPYIRLSDVDGSNGPMMAEFNEHGCLEVRENARIDSKDAIRLAKWIIAELT